MIKCISSVFNEIEGSLKKGIILRYKRVSNYNDMTSQDAYIVEMLNKRHTDREIIDGLQENYMIEEQDARMKIARLLQSIELQQLSRYRGGTIRIKNNPGFLTKITKGQFNNIISIEISNINNIKFLQLLQMYMDSIVFTRIRVQQPFHIMKLKSCVEGWLLKTRRRRRLVKAIKWARSSSRGLVVAWLPLRTYKHRKRVVNWAVL